MITKSQGSLSNTSIISLVTIRTDSIDHFRIIFLYKFRPETFGKTSFAFFNKLVLRFEKRILKFRNMLECLRWIPDINRQLKNYLNNDIIFQNKTVLMQM